MTSSNRKAPESINRLNLSQQYKLLRHMEETYVLSRMFDAEFAEHASHLLGFPISVRNIHGCREALGLISNRDLMRAEAKKPKNILEEIEQRLEKLESMAKELGWKI